MIRGLLTVALPICSRHHRATTQARMIPNRFVAVAGAQGSQDPQTRIRITHVTALDFHLKLTASCIFVSEVSGWDR